MAGSMAGFVMCKGSVMVKPLPMKASIEHIIDTLPSFESTVISVKGSNSNKRHLVDMAKVTILHTSQLQASIAGDRSIEMVEGV